MVSRLAVAAVFLAQSFALTAAAQSSAEFGRASGGEIKVVTKGTAPLSGTLGISLLGGNRGYEASTGGTLLQDRLWFFASAQQQEGVVSSQFADLKLPENVTSGATATTASTGATTATGALGASLRGRIGDGHDFSAFFEAARVPTVSFDVAPSSFLALRYTGVMSTNSFFSANVSMRK